MSRRESCIWHPMPEEVRRSSVQSRRASLAAGRRKSLNANEPDWDVEAPPTPFHCDYSARENAAEAEHTPPEAAAPPAESPKESQGAGEVSIVEMAPITVVAELQSLGDEEAAAAQPSDALVEDSRVSRTRHTVRFHGEKWAKVLRKRRTEIEASFMEDIKDSASVMAHEAKRLKIKMHDCMEVTFVMYSDSRSRQREIHVALQNCSFPKTCQRYINFEA
ncbi:hypothetical protein CUR178_03966 [Leishmania enriettii]|uniref:Flagellar attachment zone protein 1 conserved domain-containing protein n=1 Tax=Leishmania enriettii TaxID=5663 RepID=A0A836KJR0_LEIEN|nr:hypothetical protein CUR178_03966 [Leishmania enriettii]